MRSLGRLLSIPSRLVGRHPFPGPGLAIRILGPVTREQVKILQLADHIYIEEIRKADLYDQIAQAFAVLLPVKAVGVMGDQRTYEQVRINSPWNVVSLNISHFAYQVIALRAVQSEDFMTADWYLLSFPSHSSPINYCIGLHFHPRFCGTFHPALPTRLLGSIALPMIFLQSLLR